jgi:hypothetical protein
MPSSHVDLAFGTPRGLPKPAKLRGRVVVLDLAFASEAGGSSFERTTLPVIEGLGERLRAWVDHHDSVHHARFAHDPRFLLTTKAQHGACPELVTPALVERIGPIDTILCHTDFDGLASAAKWLLGGHEPYAGCDADARAIDTRMGAPGPLGERFDRALRARPRDAALFGLVVRHLSSRLADASLWGPIDEAGRALAELEAEAGRLSSGFRVLGGELAFVEVKGARPFDKTRLLLLGQERARMAAVLERDSVTFAARFDSGVNFLERFGISGGMPTRVSLSASALPSALAALGIDPSEVAG